MKKEQLFKAMSHIDDGFLEMTERSVKKKRTWVKRAVAMAACACLLVGATLVPWHEVIFTNGTKWKGMGDGNSGEIPKENESPDTGDGTLTPTDAAPSEGNTNSRFNLPSALRPYLVAEANYPDRAAYPDPGNYSGNYYQNEEYNALWNLWHNEWRLNRLNGNEKNRLDSFLIDTIPTFLSEAGSDNAVYSPLNVYIALAMLAETTDGESRNQILTLLDIEDVETLRDTVSKVWNASYRNDGYVSTLLANSFWLDEDISYKEEPLVTLTDQYYSSSFTGDMGSAEYELAYQNWLNSQTGGLLKDQIDKLEMDPETVMTLASTIYYSACWYDKFDPSENTTDTFHSPNGDVSAEFMNYKTEDFYFRGENFGAISWDFDQAGNMWLLLPDEGYTVDDILTSQDITNFFLDPSENLDRLYVELTLSLPKFDISSQLNLKEPLKELGVTDVFDMSASDFTPLTEDRDIALAEVKHGARVKIDEEGCVGVAYTVEPLAGAPQLQGKVDFILDRPFLFMITSDDGLPLFTGVVNQP